MSIAVDARQSDLKKVFSDEYEFEVPSYQRPYAWGRTQVSELLDDLLRSAGSEDAYFLGALVLVKQGDRPRASVLDGQQRLTTLTIVLAVLRDLTSDPGMRASRCKYVVQVADPDAGREEKPRLTTRARDQDFLRTHVQTLGATTGLAEGTRTETESQARMLEAALVAREILSPLDEAVRNALYFHLINRCFLVVISVGDHRSARRIFTVLNSRGVDLTPVDILKAAFLDHAGDAADDCARRWEAVEDRLGREQFTGLFETLLLTRGHEVGRNDLDERFPDLYPSFREPRAFLDKVLEPAADFLSLVDRRWDARIALGVEGAAHLKALSRLGERGWVAVALTRFLRTGEDAWVSQAPFLAALERVAYFLAVTEAKPADRIRRYVDMCAADRANMEVEGLSEVEKLAFAAALNAPMYGKAYCRPVMLKLDDLLANNGVEYNDPVTIEHVLPQRVAKGSEWEKGFKDPVRRASLWPNLIGNLVFLTRAVNARASNSDFAEKKREYVSEENGVSAYPITMDLFASPTWDLEALTARQARVVGRLQGAWGLAAGAAPSGGTDPRRDPEPTYVLGNRGEDLAKAFERDGQFVVVRGSRCLTRKFKTRSSYASMRERLVSSGIIVPDGPDAMVFTRSYAFSSISAATAVVMNRNSNAKQEWRVIGGDMTYAEANPRGAREPGVSAEEPVDALCA